MATTLSYDCIDQFQEYLSDNQYPENTRRAYVGDVTAFFSDSKVAFPVDLLSIEKAMKQWLKANSLGWAPKTLNRKVTSLRKLLVINGAVNPLMDLRLPKTLPGQPHPLPGGKQDLLAMIRSTVQSEHHALIALCGLMGLRIGEALSASADHVNLHDKALYIYGKGRVERTVPISPDAWKYLGPMYTSMWMASNGKPTGRFVGYSDRTARNIITRLGRAAGIAREIASHDLRATFATEAYKVSKDIRAVAALLGHSDTRTTMIYIEAGADTLRAAASFGLEDE